MARKKKASQPGRRGRKPKSVPRYLKCNASFIMTATNCLLQAFRETYLEIREFNLPMTVLGTSVHKMFELAMKRHKRTKRYPYATMKALIGAWWGFWSTAAFRPEEMEKPSAAHGFEGYGTPWQEVSWKSYPEDPERLRQSGCAYMAMFFKTFDRFRLSGIPIWVERQFKFWWQGICWTGRVDLILFEPDGAIIVDYKPSDYTEPVRLSGVQATFYQLAYELFFRKNAPGRVPLKAIWIYNYKSGKIQNVPLRDSHEFGMLVKIAQEFSRYYGAVLHGIALPPGFVFEINSFHLDDITRGDITPHFPRGDHCKYCGHIKACIDWEHGLLPPASDQFALKLLTDSDAKAPLQLRLPFNQLPVVLRVSATFTQLMQPQPIQQKLDLT